MIKFKPGAEEDRSDVVLDLSSKVCASKKFALFSAHFPTTFLGRFILPHHLLLKKQSNPFIFSDLHRFEDRFLSDPILAFRLAPAIWLSPPWISQITDHNG